MFHHVRKIYGVAAVVMGIALITATQADASTAATATRSAGARLPIMVTDSGYRPARDFQQDFQGACGTLITAFRAANTTNHRVTRTITFRNGDVLTTSKGTEFVTFVDTNAQNNTVGGIPVTLPISGTVTKLKSASGAVLVNRQGPSLILASDSPFNFTPQGAALQRAHLRNFSAFTGGSFTESTNAAGDLTRIIRKPATTRSICELMGLGAYQTADVLFGEDELDGTGF